MLKNVGDPQGDQPGTGTGNPGGNPGGKTPDEIAAAQQALKAISLFFPDMATWAPPPALSAQLAQTRQWLTPKPASFWWAQHKAPNPAGATFNNSGYYGGLLGGSKSVANQLPGIGGIFGYTGDSPSGPGPFGPGAGGPPSVPSLPAGLPQFHPSTINAAGISKLFGGGGGIIGSPGGPNAPSGPGLLPVPGGGGSATESSTSTVWPGGPTLSGDATSATPKPLPANMMARLPSWAAGGKISASKMDGLLDSQTWLDVNGRPLTSTAAKAAMAAGIPVTTYGAPFSTGMYVVSDGAGGYKVVTV